MPMNIQPKNWQGLVEDNADFDDPRTNIRAGARLLARIRDRIENPTPEKIGSIYNFAGQEQVVGWGEKIARAYDEKAWTQGPLPTGPNPDLKGFAPRPLRKRER